MAHRRCQKRGGMHGNSGIQSLGLCHNWVSVEVYVPSLFLMILVWETLVAGLESGLCMRFKLVVLVCDAGGG